MTGGGQTDPFEALLAEARSHTYPPVHLWNPEREIPMDMRIALDGSWYHDGTRITRASLVRLFASILKVDDDGRHWLVTPTERAPVEVEDVAFVVTGVERREGDNGPELLLTTNVGDHVLVDAEHPLTMRDGPAGRAPYVPVRGGLEARVGRNVYYWLAEHALEEGPDGVGVRSCGGFYRLE